MADSAQKFGAGILFIAPNDQVLFLRRGRDGDHAGEWCFPGGHRDYEETSWETAYREATEEAGSAWHDLCDGPPSLWTTRQNDDMKLFTTFVQRVKEQFPVSLSDEHVGSGWFDLLDPPKPLHPGCKVALDRFFLDELGIARAIAGGELTSPQTYANVTLYALRITGTGHSYRPGSKEYVWRPPEHYLEDEFLARCNGLPVVWLHPKNHMMTAADFKNSVIGTIMLPYIKGDEVWGIAKIYDATALENIKTAMSADGKGISTSPGVWGVGGTKKDLGGGDHALFEEKPLLLDHLAVVDAGVWDKGGEPSGVSSTTMDHGDLKMSEEAKTATGEGAEGRADAATATKEPIDHMLSKLDAAMSKLDAACARMDSYDEKEAKRDSEKQAKKDRKARFDSLSAKRDSEGLTADESKEFSEMEKDKKDKAKKDAAGEASEAHSREGEAIGAAKAEHEKEGAAMDKAKKDAAEEDAKHDSLVAVVEDLKRQLSETRQMVSGPSREDEDAMLTAQARFDGVAQLFSDSAPRAMAGERPLQYRKRMAKGYQQYSTDWKSVNLSVLEGAAFDIAEGQILEQARRFALSSESVPVNTLHEIRTRDETGRTITSFKGDAGACWDRFKSPVRRVTQFNQNNTRH